MAVDWLFDTLAEMSGRFGRGVTAGLETGEGKVGGSGAGGVLK